MGLDKMISNGGKIKLSLMQSYNIGEGMMLEHVVPLRHGCVFMPIKYRNCNFDSVQNTR